MISSQKVIKENGKEVILISKFQKNTKGNDSLQVFFEDEIIYEYDLKFNEDYVDHATKMNLQKWVYPTLKEWDDREIFKKNWANQERLIHEIIVWGQSIIKEKNDLEAQAFRSEILKAEQMYPQTSKIPSGSILLGYSLIDGSKLIRAYNLWDDGEKKLHQFITKNGGEPLYTRIVYAASANFSNFWKVLHEGVLTDTGKKYTNKHGEKYYSREKVF